MAPTTPLLNPPPAMLRLDPTTLPDPSRPLPGDAYGTASGRHNLVVTDYDTRFTTTPTVFAFFNSAPIKVANKIPGEPGFDMFPAFLASAGLQPTGRMTLELLPTAPTSRPQSRTDGEVQAWREGVEVGRREALDPVDGGLHETEDLRTAAERMGPALRLLRERCGIRLGVLANALRCQKSSLSAFELGERPGDTQPRGTSEMDRTIERSLHPSGRCTCAPGTLCEWCKMDEARGYADAEAEAAVEAQAALDAVHARNSPRTFTSSSPTDRLVPAPPVPRGHEVDITADVERGVMVGLIEEAINLLESAIATDDQQHVGECIGDARKMLYKAIEPVAD